MADLKSLFPKKPVAEAQSAKAQAPTHEAVGSLAGRPDNQDKEPSRGHESVAQAATTASIGRKNPFGGIARSSVDSHSTESVEASQPTGEAERSVAQGQPSDAGATPRLAGIFGKGKDAVGGIAPSTTSGTAPRLASPALTAGLGRTDSAPAKPVGNIGDSLADLDSIDLDSAIENRDDEIGLAGLSQFPDETPATAPTRELPADLDKSQLQFIDLIDGIYGIIHDHELLGNVIRSIMVELKTHPQYMKLVAKEDIRTWVRAMRDTMGLARIKKQEKKSSRGNGRTAKSVDSDMLKDLEDLGIEL